MEGIRDITSAFGALTPAERRRLGRMGGLLLLAGSLFSFPAGWALEPVPQLREHAVGISGVLTGIAVYLAPWERISSAWLHVVPIVGGFEIALGVGIFSDDYAFYYVLLSIYAAYIVRDRSVLIAYMTFFTILLLAPISYAEEDLKEQMHHILVTFPVFVIAALIVRYLRDTVERRERQYRSFAQEAVELAIRLRRRKEEGSLDQLDERLDELAAETQATAVEGDGRD